jgi:DNA-binding transcriptional LysR family regulator
MADHKRIEKLMLFVEVARTLSYSRAAESLGMSKSYLSEQIKRLETELKTPLIIRTTRSVRLTPQGELVLAQAEDLKRRVVELEHSLLQHSEEISGLIRITAPKMFSERLLHDVCVAFRRQHPKVEFDILSSYRAFNLSETDVDFAFRATLNPPENMIACHLFDYHHLLVASPDYLRQAPKLACAEDLKNHQCLTTMHQRSWPLASGDIEVKGWLSTNENRLLRESALAGHGITRIASYFVEKELQEEKLINLLSEETTDKFGSIYLLYPQLIYQSKKTRAFIDFVQKYFSD